MSHCEEFLKLMFCALALGQTWSLFPEANCYRQFALFNSASHFQSLRLANLFASIKFVSNSHLKLMNYIV